MTVIQQPVSPNLPLAPGQYDSRYQEQFNNVLRLYFNRLNNNLLSLFNTYGGQYLNFPFGSFFDVGNQVAVSTTTAYAVRLNNTSYANGVSVVDDSKITFSYSGVYNIQFSIQMANYANGEQDIDIWFRKNGVDIPNSSSRFGQAPRKSVGVPSHIIGTVNLFVDVIEGDYVELYWHTSDTDTYIQYYGPDTSPTRPAIPSVILTVSFVSSTSGIVTTGTTSVALSGVSSSGSVGTVTP